MSGPPVRQPSSRGVDQLLTPDEVCAILRVSKPWLYAQVQRKRFPSIRFNGRSLRFKADDIQRFIDQQYQTSG